MLKSLVNNCPLYVHTRTDPADSLLARELAFYSLVQGQNADCVKGMQD